MRPNLFFNPRLLCERLAELSISLRRKKKLRHSVANQLKLGHIDSLELLELLLSKPPTVIYDVGANVGTWTLLAKAVFPESEIHAFEPLREHCEKFIALTAGIPKVYLHPIALGDIPQRKVMTITDNSDASSLFDMTAASLTYLTAVGEEEVTIETLDEWTCRMGIPEPDLIKLDIQGYELKALLGGQRSLKNAHAVLSEVSFIEFYHGQCLFHELVTFLAERSFHVQAFGATMAYGRRINQTDVLFEKNI